jgi:hypothetical protein
MAKPLKFHHTLNQAPRSPKHGQHRRARPSSHRDPVVGTDHSSGGADQVRTVTVSWSSFNAVSLTELDPFTEPKPPAVPSAGIRTGEIVAHRLWWVIEGQLCSLAHRRLWKPGETIYGNTMESVDLIMAMMGHPIWGGTYGFFRQEQMAEDIAEMSHLLRRIEHHRAHGILTPRFLGWNGVSEASAFVAGTIKMWGDVVEHEFGYRAEYAKLNSIDNIYGTGEMIPLRERYGVGALLPP